MTKLDMGVNLRTGLLLLTLTLAKCQDYTILENDDYGYWDRIEDTDIQAQQLLRSLCDNYDMSMNNQWIDCSTIQLTPKKVFWDVNDNLLVNLKLQKRDVEEELTEGSGNGIINLASLENSAEQPKDGDDAAPTLYEPPANNTEPKELQPAEEVAVKENEVEGSVVVNEGNKEEPEPEVPEPLENGQQLEAELQLAAQSAAGASADEEPGQIPVDSVNQQELNGAGNDSPVEIPSENEGPAKLENEEAPAGDVDTAEADKSLSVLVEPPSENDNSAKSEGEEPTAEGVAPEPNGASNDSLAETPNGNDGPTELESEETPAGNNTAEVDQPLAAPVETASENEGSEKTEGEEAPASDAVPQPENSAASVDPVEGDKPLDNEQILPVDAVRAPELNGEDSPVETPSEDDEAIKPEDEEATAEDVVPQPENAESNADAVEGDKPLDTEQILPVDVEQEPELGVESPSKDNGEVKVEGEEASAEGAVSQPEDSAAEADKPVDKESPIDTEVDEGQQPAKGDDAQLDVDKTDQVPAQPEDSQKPISAFGLASLDTQQNKEELPKPATTLTPTVVESNKDTSAAEDKPKESEKVDDNQSGTAVLMQEPTVSNPSIVEGSDTEKHLSALSASSDETNGSSEQPKIAESATGISNRGKDATVLIVLFVVVLVIGAAAFTHHFIKKRRANNDHSSINGITKDLESPKNGDVEQGVEMKPLLNSNSKPVIVKEFSDKKNNETA